MKVSGNLKESYLSDDIEFVEDTVIKPQNYL